MRKEKAVHPSHRPAKKKAQPRKVRRYPFRRRRRAGCWKASNLMPSVVCRWDKVSKANHRIAVSVTGDRHGDYCEEMPVAGHPTALMQSWRDDRWFASWVLGVGLWMFVPLDGLHPCSGRGQRTTFFTASPLSARTTYGEPTFD